MPTAVKVTYSIHQPTKNIEVAERLVEYEDRPTPDGGIERHVLMTHSIHRHVLEPGADLSNQHPDVAAAAREAWATPTPAEE